VIKGYDPSSYVRIFLDKPPQMTKLSSHDIVSAYHSANNGFIHDEMEVHGRLADKQFLAFHTKINKRIDPEGIASFNIA